MKNKNERGVVVVEASIVVTLVMLLITLMLYVGMAMYQQTIVSVISNQTASNLAQVYSNNIKDPFTGYVEPEKVYQSVTYSNMKTDAYMDVIEQKANLYAKYRLKSSRVLAAETSNVSVDVVKKPGELLKSQVVVTIKDSYDIPLVSFFNVNGLVTFESQGRADCVDILEYVNGVEAVGNPETSNIEGVGNLKICTVTFIPDRSKPNRTTIVKVLKGKSILTSTDYTHCVMPKNPTNGTFEFAGWVDSGGAGFSASTTVNGNMVVYSSWRCKVTLDPKGGSVSGQNPISVIVGTRTYIPNPERYGHNFLGWYTETEGRGVRYISNDTVINNDVTLYAHWACAHPSSYDVVEGAQCEGGKIETRCSLCHVLLSTFNYTGEHAYDARCNVRHTNWNYFDGVGKSGGCGVYHVKGEYCGSCKEVHTDIGSYCVVCINCHKKKGTNWCANKHSGTAGLPKITPVNGHAR